MKTKQTDHEYLLAQLQAIAQGLGETFAPFCEVVVHDLTNQEQAILAIHNNLSEREVGQPVTELGLQRISDPNYPAVLANYPNRFPDGRQAKSTSIGIKDKSGKYVAALCMNVDLTLFHNLQNMLSQFGSTAGDPALKETIAPRGTQSLLERIDTFAAQRATTPRALKLDERRALLQELKGAGLLEMRRAMDTVAQHLGVSRTTLYLDAKQIDL